MTEALNPHNPENSPSNSEERPPQVVRETGLLADYQNILNPLLIEIKEDATTADQKSALAKKITELIHSEELYTYDGYLHAHGYEIEQTAEDRIAVINQRIIDLRTNSKFQDPENFPLSEFATLVNDVLSALLDSPATKYFYDPETETIFSLTKPVKVVTADELRNRSSQ